MKVPRDLQELAPRSPHESWRDGAFELPPARRRLPTIVRVLIGFLAGATIAGTGAAVGLARYGGAYAKSEFAAERIVGADVSGLKRTPADELARLEKHLSRLAPHNDVYVVVDTFRNRLRVFKRGELIREAICSTGSGVRLRDPRDGKEWVFDTPQGELRILRKVKDPVWVKPDWAFIEEGFEPPKSMRARIDDYSLGSYGLYMRDGYIIHGTIFKTLLGKRVTHGCIRLGDEDLEFVFRNVPAGARVFLY